MQLAKKRIGIQAFVILMFAVIIFTLSGACDIHAAEAKIGLVNLTQIISSHPFTQNINQIGINLRDELKNRQENLNAQGKGLDETELQKLEDSFNKEWEPIKEKFIAELKAYQAARYSGVLEAIQLVGENGKYDLIVNTEIKIPTGSDILSYPVTLYGGEDITQDVIVEINKKLEEAAKNEDKAQ